MPQLSDDVILDAIRQQHGPAYDVFGPEEQAGHCELLRQVRKAEDVVLDARPGKGASWTVTIAAADHIGLLSLIAGLFVARRIDISSGSFFTVRFQPAGRPAGRDLFRRRRPGTTPEVYQKILDVFEVTAPTGQADFWEDFRRELASVIGLVAAGQADQAREEVIDRVSAAAQAGGTDDRLYPVSVTIDNDSSPTLTGLRIQATDTLGFIFEFANALTMLRVNIERVDVRTIGDVVDDTFWVRDASGNKITEPEKLQQLRFAAALIKQFTHLLPRSPDPALALRQFSALAVETLSHPERAREFWSLQSADVLRTLTELMGVSRFLWEDFLRMQHENLFPVLTDSPGLDERKSKQALEAELERELAGAPEGKVVSRLNRFKDRELFRIDLRHITHRIDFVTFSEELSDLAEVTVARAVELAHLPLGPWPCRWCVLALGKCGGRELGFASDIELLFVYGGQGNGNGVRRAEEGRYFEELVQGFLGTLTARQEGIFQIDLRLRPHGKGGPLASSLDALRAYFSPEGSAKQFERMALVKLRPIAGDGPLAEEVLRVRDAFVYSGEPLDRDNIIHLRRRQATELVPPGAVNAKYSPGGLVDLEYFVQARQIEAGAAHREVRITNTLGAVAALVKAGALEESLARRIRDAYGFLRRLIDALRVVRGHAKDLTIPGADSHAFWYLSRRLGYTDSGPLQQDITRWMAFARGLWEGKSG